MFSSTIPLDDHLSLYMLSICISQNTGIVKLKNIKLNVFFEIQIPLLNCFYQNVIFIASSFMFSEVSQLIFTMHEQ